MARNTKRVRFFAFHPATIQYDQPLHRI